MDCYGYGYEKLNCTILWIHFNLVNENTANAVQCLLNKLAQILHPILWEYLMDKTPLTHVARFTKTAQEFPVGILV